MSKEVVRRNNPHWIIQLLWFLLIGWWAGEIWIAVAWLLLASVIGLPFGIAMFNSLPKVIALRNPDETLRSTKDSSGGTTEQKVKQRPFILRAIYFIVIGLWLSFIWVEVAYLLCLTIIGMPIGFRMFDKADTILTLKR